jgi:hypothetical protein
MRPEQFDSVAIVVGFFALVLAALAVIVRPEGRGGARRGRPKGGPYCVPRRYGVRTMLVVVTAFGALFGGLKWAGAGGGALVGVSMYVASIGIAQMFFPKAPRAASACVGSLITSGAFLLFSDWLEGYRFQSEPAAFGLQCVALAVCIGVIVLLGLLAGYVVGTLVSGVFLVMDQVENVFRDKAE